MCHFGSSGYEGNFLDTQNAVEFEKNIANTMLDIYAHSATGGKFFQENYKGMTQGKIKNYIKNKLRGGDWYLNSRETVTYGFADAILTDEPYGSLSKLK
jgi:ATP-dependent protease ClpP protease subunit